MQSTTTFDVATLVHTGISCLTSSTSSSWIIDSGASIHLTGKSTLFSTFNPSSIAYIITLADGSSKFITGTGTVHPTSSLVLFDAHHIYGVPFNLLYVSRLIKSLNCTITFSPPSCMLQDL